ncbi:MAG: O-antigen ligase family protein [Planctomycetota bacterium]|jgi:O-antigen ligase
MEIGLCLFCAGAIIAGFASSNKRVAITDAVCLLAPLFCAILLVQILDSQSKIKLVLAVIAALGVVSAYQCAEQFFISNQVTIDQYEQAPLTILEPLGIKPASFRQFLFEHRLYTRGVRGFFTTGNSAGSFAMLASFAAIALFLEKFKNRKSDPAGPPHLVTCGIAVAAVFFGLAITKSKGAIAASLIAAVMFITYLLFGNWLKRHKKTIVIICLLFFIAGGCGVAAYGLTHGRLPGGNSMLVRWQYWYASAQMYSDHPLTGIGPGNFTNFYPHYKPGAAIESVADPHNFLLSLLTQYGPLGLVGFLAMIVLPLLRVISPRPALVLPETYQLGPTFKKLAAGCIIVISVSLLLMRPIIMPVAAGEDVDVMIYVVFALYIAPVAAFVVGFWLLTAGGISSRTPNTNIAAALFCACIGVTLHNLIDFAIFEPGVLITFWVIMAVLIAMDSEYKHRAQFVFKPAPFAKVIVVAVGLIITWAYLNYVLIPVAKSTTKIREANQVSLYGDFRQAHSLLIAAAQDDFLSPAASSMNGRLYLQRFVTGSKHGDLLLYSEKCLLDAIDRNRNDFKNFERLVNVYTLLAETSIPQEKTDWLNKAFDSANRAVQLYPGSGRLRVKLAEIADLLDKTDTALEHYQKAIDIEDSFRVQFRLMYPDWEMFSRLGEEKYDFAKQRVRQLCGKSAP